MDAYTDNHLRRWIQACLYQRHPDYRLKLHSISFEHQMSCTKMVCSVHPGKVFHPSPGLLYDFLMSIQIWRGFHQVPEELSRQNPYLATSLLGASVLAIPTSFNDALEGFQRCYLVTRASLLMWGRLIGCRGPLFNFRQGLNWVHLFACCQVRIPQRVSTYDFHYEHAKHEACTLISLSTAYISRILKTKRKLKLYCCFTFDLSPTPYFLAMHRGPILSIFSLE